MKKFVFLISIGLMAFLGACGDAEPEAPSEIEVRRMTHTPDPHAILTPSIDPTLMVHPDDLAPTAISLAASDLPSDFIQPPFAETAYLPMMDTPRYAGDYQVPSTLGTDFDFTAYRGKFLLVYFGYTHCPDVCPNTLGALRMAYSRTEANPEQVAVVFVTVDPERDTLENMQTYLGAFHPDFIGVRAEDEALLKAVMGNFGAVAAREEQSDSATDYTMVHTGSVYVVDPQGYIVGRFVTNTNVDNMTHDLRLILDSLPKYAS